MYSIPTIEEIKKIPKSIKIISLFAGGGGSSTGYKMAGGNVLLVNEFIKLASETYSANWPETLVLTDDIRKLDPIKVLERVNLKPYELDLLDGSPPCCGFSIAGGRDKYWNTTRKYSDKTQANVEDLFFEYIRFLESIKPKVFVAENVKGLTMGPSKGYFNGILRGLRGAGYHVECRLINSAYLGVPQRRERVIFIGVREDLMRDSYKENLHPKPQTDFISLNEAFQNLIYDNAEVSYLTGAIKKYSVYYRLLKLLPGETVKNFFGLQKEDPLLPCRTLKANGDISCSCSKHWDNRPFTVGELKRIQSLPDDYILLGNYEKQAERIGRMVPPLVTKSILENLKSIGVFDDNR